MNVATNFRTDRETAELGEDYEHLATVEAAYRALEATLIHVAVRVKSKRARIAVTEFAETLSDAAHDASIITTVSLARDAAAEARVVRIGVRS